MEKSSSKTFVTRGSIPINHGWTSLIHPLQSEFQRGMLRKKIRRRCSRSFQWSPRCVGFQRRFLNSSNWRCSIAFVGNDFFHGQFVITINEQASRMAIVDNEFGTVQSLHFFR